MLTVPHAALTLADLLERQALFLTDLRLRGAAREAADEVRQLRLLAAIEAAGQPLARCANPWNGPRT